MQLETERLLIREVKAQDFEAIHAYASDPNVVRYMIWGPNSEQDTQDHIQRCLNMQLQIPRAGYEWAVVLKQTGRLIGGCGLHVEQPLQAELGYCFHADYWGQGYAFEAATALLKFGFGELGLHRMYATCRPANIGSEKVMQKAGMKYEGHLREHMWHKGQWHDSYLYSILKHEFKGMTG
ncbi:GNAT family N-acetyltransferase [Cohnella pontilimi]|uniref:GNAT family N-acetyltransferase n=1 Tax=Cohnella pontilimi TaxID=2564100 RepID=A0A4U0FIP6_9BACL|nr:GNAT family protein [Cohnella pontilimi]TJY43322.1 GNAT family N-acetyltransferase [Cohnella pontilimi]